MHQPSRILDAQAYLQQALARGLPFAVVIGGPDSGKEMLVRRFLQEQLVSHSAHLSAATRDPHAFLERVLEQLGFEPFDSSSEELQKLLCVFACHEAAQGRRTLILLEDAQEFGPHVLEAVRQIVLQIPDRPSPLHFVLTGSANLHRILDSAGMRDVSELTHWRFTLDEGDNDDNVIRPILEITLRGKLVDRLVLDQPRLMIGRHAQNDLTLDNRFVSRHHCLLVSRADAIYVVDLRSTNGTFVNGGQVHRHALADGDVLQVGNFRLRYCEPLGALRPAGDEDRDHSDTGVLGPQAVAS